MGLCRKGVLLLNSVVQLTSVSYCIFQISQLCFQDHLLVFAGVVISIAGVMVLSILPIATGR